MTSRRANESNPELMSRKEIEPPEFSDYSRKVASAEESAAPIARLSSFMIRVSVPHRREIWREHRLNMRWGEQLIGQALVALAMLALLVPFYWNRVLALATIMQRSGCLLHDGELGLRSAPAGTRLEEYWHTKRDRRLFSSARPPDGNPLSERGTTRVPTAS